MSLQPSFSKEFERNIKKAKKQGKDIELAKKIIRDLIDQIPLAEKHRDHPLRGDYKDHRECHIQPDWLLIYRIEEKEDCIYFVRLGSHSELFR